MNQKKSLKDRIKLIYKYFYIVLFFMIISGCITYYFSSKLPGYYESNATILIDNNSNKNNYKINTFITHLKSKDILNEIVAETNNLYEVEEIVNIISVKNIKNTDLIKLSAKSTSPDDLKLIITSWINVFNKQISTIYPNEEIKIIESAVVDYNIKSTNIYLFTGSGVLLGFLISSILISLLGTIDVTIKNHEEIKKYLNLKSLGIIPLNYIDEVGQPKKQKKNNRNQDNLKIINNSSSLISESYRIVRTNLDFLDLKVISFTSTAAGEGKSESLANVALSFSMIGKKVLIIDCDLRKPVMHKLFNLNRTLGISDIILYNRMTDYKNIIQSFKVPNNEYQIDVLTAGSKIYNPSELLDSNRFKNFINIIKEEYDLILIDCPPVSLVTDATVVAKVVDGTAFIIEYNRMNYQAIKSCLDSLNNVNACILGSILTKVNIFKQKKLYGNKYEYYTNYI